MKKILLFLIVCVASTQTIFANYKKNIDDEIKVHALAVKVEHILKKNTKKLVRELLKIKIEKKIWKTKKEIWAINILYNTNFTSIQEYMWLRIYKQIDNGLLYTGVPKIIENNWIRVLMFDWADYTIITDWNKFIEEWPHARSLVLEVFYIPNWLNIVDFMNNLLKPDDCTVKENSRKKWYADWMPWKWTYSLIRKNQDNREFINEDYCTSSSKKYFKKISPNVWIFVSISKTEFKHTPSIDISTIEIHKKNNKIALETWKRLWDNIILRKEGKIRYIYIDDALLEISYGNIAKVREWNNGIFYIHSNFNSKRSLRYIDKDKKKKIIASEVWNYKKISGYEILWWDKVKVLFTIKTEETIEF